MRRESSASAADLPNQSVKLQVLIEEERVKISSVESGSKVRRIRCNRLSYVQTRVKQNFFSFSTESFGLVSQESRPYLGTRVLDKHSSPMLSIRTGHLRNKYFTLRFSIILNYSFLSRLQLVEFKCSLDEVSSSIFSKNV